MWDTGFDAIPKVSSRLLKEIAERGLVNIVGSCCGTTPAHTGAIGAAVGPLGARVLGRPGVFRMGSPNGARRERHGVVLVKVFGTFL